MRSFEQSSNNASVALWKPLKNISIQVAKRESGLYCKSDSDGIFLVTGGRIRRP